ncbi:hypothetical protein LPU83_pLPU83b_0439 (plasmid) [Rhizobium favelukesii]|uniref:Uncharacterized protein n=1 Tax=Rhizobium favelukesii TaxID=348824 RepID=W6RHZ8_9HYPH|nr:hypothetical protein LPU83_pLPU83b_0439 [Rhizobium favelukesii]
MWFGKACRCRLFWNARRSVPMRPTYGLPASSGASTQKSKNLIKRTYLSRKHLQKKFFSHLKSTVSRSLRSAEVRFDWLCRVGMERTP